MMMMVSSILKCAYITPILKKQTWVLVSQIRIDQSAVTLNSPLAFRQHLHFSTLGYNFDTVVNFLDEGKFWYHFLTFFILRRNVPLICPRL